MQDKDEVLDVQKKVLQFDFDLLLFSQTEF